MISYEKKYWSINEYHLQNGNPYEGYVGIYDGKAYIYDTQEELIINDNYYSQLNTSKMFFDRILDEPLKLPYGKKEMTFQANDFLYRSTIKSILQKLQANNDYIYKCSTISDTLIPAVDDCSILATTNNSYYVFVGADKKEYKEIPTSQNSNTNNIKKSVEDGYIINPDFDTSLLESTKDLTKLVYPLKKGDKPKSKYPSRWRMIPNVKYVLDLEYGKLKRYNLSAQTNTKTALDPTFYEQVLEDGTIVTPPYNFDDIVSTDAIITDVGMQEIVITESGVKEYKDDYKLKDGEEKIKVKRIRLLFFIAFKDKIVIIRYVYYPDDFYANYWLGSSIDFLEGTRDLIVLDCVDPSNKNSLSYLSLKDIRVYGNYMYVVDEKLNMVLRYNIEFIRTPQGVMSWDKRSICLMDYLQGEGGVGSHIYFNKPNSICADDENIYVVDRGNGCIKKYSSAFDYEATIRNGNFATHDIQTISINPYSFKMDDGTVLPPNSLWVFSSTGIHMYVHVISGTRVMYSHVIDNLEMLKDKYMWDEEFKSVKFSFCNSNYYYLCTTKRVYKIHLSKPHYPFASLSYFKQRSVLTTMVWSRVPYPWHTLPCGEDESGIDVTWGFRPSTTSAEILDNRGFCLCGADRYTIIDEDNNREQFNGDIIFHIGTLYNQNKIDTFCKRNMCTFKDIPQYEKAQMIKCSGIFVYNETTSWLSSLTRLDFPAYTSDDIEDIASSEYVNNHTFNKMIYKVVYNLTNLKNHIIGKFWGAYNLDNIMIYDQLEYDDFFQQLRIDRDDDLFVHDNEPMSIMINRIFEKIYDLQETILDHMESKYRSQGAFTNNSFRII